MKRGWDECRGCDDGPRHAGSGSRPAVVASASLVMSFSHQPGTLQLQHHNINTTNIMMKPIDHARCRELAHPDIVNFGVSV